MALLTRNHTVLSTTHMFIHKWNEPYLPFLPSRTASPHIWPVLIFRPAELASVAGYKPRWFTRPQMPDVE